MKLVLIRLVFQAGACHDRADEAGASSERVIAKCSFKKKSLSVKNKKRCNLSITAFIEIY
jgi:hypothetical protein